MKISKLIPLVLFISCFLFCLDLFSQNTSVWIGGAPGHETEWSYYKNWSNGMVPDWSSDVVIPDRSFYDDSNYPEITSGSYEINSLSVEGNAKLSIAPNSKLDLIFMLEVYGRHIENSGELIVDGELISRPQDNNTILFAEEKLFTNQ